MATPDGKVAIEVDGRGHTLYFSTNALCRLEDRLGKTTIEVATELQLNPSMTLVRTMIWAALGQDDLTLAEAGDMIDALGKIEAIALVREAYAAAFPDAAPDKDDEKRPRRAAAG